MYLLDTNFLINLQKRKNNELQFLLDNAVDFADCAISVITWLTNSFLDICRRIF